MKYRIKASGREIVKGDYVQLKVTSRVINFLKELNLIEEVPDDRDILNILKNIFDI